MYSEQAERFRGGGRRLFKISQKKEEETLLPGPQPTADGASVQLTIPFLILAGFLGV